MPQAKRTSEGKYKCSYNGCSKAYGVKSSLDDHIQGTHKGGYLCQHCAAAGQEMLLANARGLRRHQESCLHNSSRQIVKVRCTHPGCTYEGRQDNLQRHFQLRHRAILLAAEAALAAQEALPTEEALVAEEALPAQEAAPMVAAPPTGVENSIPAPAQTGVEEEALEEDGDLESSDFFDAVSHWHLDYEVPSPDNQSW
jgi:hypothetical protein